MRRFVHIGKRSNKFWLIYDSVEVIAKTGRTFWKVTTCAGTVGTIGRYQERLICSKEDAVAWIDKAIQAKQRRGYFKADTV